MTGMAAEVRDRLDEPAEEKPCDRCRTPTLLRPGGLCAACVAAVGLADDQGEYTAWRRRVSDEVAAGNPAGRM